MSFILDALKKSENERQHNAPAEFATVPSSDGTSRAPRWLWVLGALLAINVVVLLGLLLRPAPAPPVRATAPATAPASVEPAATAPAESFAERLDAARDRRPERVAEVSTTPPAAEPEPAAPTARSAPAAETSALFLPSLAELRADGTLNLPELHVDIHVYSDSASDRFVFINMVKYRENERLKEGPLLREITRDGVVLEHRGTSFSLARE